MKIKLNWGMPLPLRWSSKETLIYSMNFNKVPRMPGIYIYARRWKNKYEALYIGQSQNLQGRISGHLKNLPLMKHIEKSKNGRKVLFYGVIYLAPGQQLGKVLKIAEKGLYSIFFKKGHDIANKLSTRIMKHVVESEGKTKKAFIPSSMDFEI